jgi:hypothetical protein
MLVEIISSFASKTKCVDCRIGDELGLLPPHKLWISEKPHALNSVEEKEAKRPLQKQKEANRKYFNVTQQQKVASKLATFLTYC